MHFILDLVLYVCLYVVLKLVPPPQYKGGEMHFICGKLSSNIHFLTQCLSYSKLVVSKLKG